MATAFQEKVWKLTSKVPKGKVTSYAAIAHALGTGAYRAVGNALNKNPWPTKTPCHRVVNSDGRIGGWAHDVDEKIAALNKEGIMVRDGKIVDFRKHYITQFR